MQGSQEPFSVGGVRQDLQGVRGEQAYAIEAVCRADRLASPLRSVLVRLTWNKGGQPLHPAGWLVRGPQVAGGKLNFSDVLVAPAGADGACLSLELKWPQDGSIVWERVSVRPTTPPPPRKVKIGTVYLRPSKSTPERNVQLYCEQLDAAGRLGLDIVCLPEAVTQVGTPLTAAQVAEPIPGPTTERFAAAAKRNRLWVVTCFNEREGERIYNTAILLDRAGHLAGKYRKVHLPREEWQKGIIPGAEYPVFKTDFGTVAMQICYDWFFPEIATIWGLKGAEVVFAPTWGTTFPDQEGRAEGETVFRVRARDNGYYLVPSVFDGNSLIIDPLGRILASSKGQTGLFSAEVDLTRREPLWWVGHWGSIGPRDRMPDTYGGLQADPE
jgi:predicted amidohydrolase